MISQQAIDRVFDSGHTACNAKSRVSLEMCLPCAEFLIQALGKVGNQLQALGADAGLRYYVAAFEADLLTQVIRQVPDDELVSSFR